MQTSADPLLPEGSSETVYAVPATHQTDANPTTWWSAYSRAASPNLTQTAWSILTDDSDYIVEKGIFGAGQPAPASWPSRRVRRGLVMGSVQSGKTASMLGVSARLLDDGVDAVVILAGTRVSLWRQTFERLTRQLDIGPAGAAKERRRILIPSPALVTDDATGIPLSSLYALPRQRVRRALKSGQPILAVVMKHADHLRALGETLRDQVYPQLAQVDRPFHLVVLDDEADDGSILDANVESSLDPALGDLKQIPRAIADLWDTRPRSGSSAAPNLFVTYVGYTATPQANLLQSDHNPLAPTDFIASLRTPYDVGQVAPRSTTFREPRGLSSYYTGGETFYRRGSKAGLVIESSTTPMDDLAAGIRGFLVAGAIRLLRGPEATGPKSIRAVTFQSEQEAKSASPYPHSMLIHPSALKDEHFAVAEDILKWAGVATRGEAKRLLESGNPMLPTQLADALMSDEAPWRDWHARYVESAHRIQEEFDLPQPRSIPAWDDVREKLLTELIPATRVSVVNSDPRADDRPGFDCWEDEDGWHAPRDLSTIFVSGNVMSRGLTLEGLTTTLFLRHSNRPFADTQMQMQRWFGYRGSYIELCRVIAPRRQLNLFRSFHEGDEALRRHVVHAMNADVSRAPSPVVLQGSDFLATGKIASIGNQPLCPGASPFIRLTNDGKQEDPNALLVSELFREHESADVSVGGRLRGRILTEPLALSDAASVLDRLVFEKYAPGRGNWQDARWSAVESHSGVSSDDSRLHPLYRSRDPQPGLPASEVRLDCPYAIGAFLRLWEACLTRHARGFFPTDNPNLQWSMVDLAKKQTEQPKFWIGIRYGRGAPISTGPMSDLGFTIRAMERTVVGGELVAGWGSRNPGGGPDPYLGDALFDYHHHHGTPPKTVAGEPLWRPAGSDGLILFHVIEQEGRPFPTIAVGTCIPLGGPDQFAAFVSSASLPVGDAS